MPGRPQIVLAGAHGVGRLGDGTRTMTRAASARMETFASDFAFRIWPSTTAAVASSTEGSPTAARLSRRADADPDAEADADGHDARCTDPSCHQDHTSSVTNGRNGANSRSSTDSAVRSAPRADAAPAPEPYARAFTSSR